MSRALVCAVAFKAMQVVIKTDVENAYLCVCVCVCVWMWMCECRCVSLCTCPFLQSRGMRLVGLLDGEFMNSREHRVNQKRRKEKPQITKQQRLVMRMQAWARGSRLLSLSLAPAQHALKWRACQRGIAVKSATGIIMVWILLSSENLT